MSPFMWNQKASGFAFLEFRMIHFILRNGFIIK